MKNLYLLATMLLLSSSLALRAQVVVYTPDTLVAPSELVTIDVRTQNFTNIATAQFSINWDADVLGFQGLTNLNLPGLSADNLGANFGTTTAPDGRIGFLWSEENFDGYDLPTDAVLFSIIFSATGDNGDTTQIAITNDPTDIEIADPAGQVQVAELTAGTVRLDESVNTTNLPAPSLRGVRLSGNPVTTATRVEYELLRAATLKINWLSTDGRLLDTQTFNHSAGRYTQPIVPNHLPAAGVYIVQLQTTDFTVAHRVLLVR